MLNLISNLSILLAHSIIKTSFLILLLYHNLLIFHVCFNMFYENVSMSFKYRESRIVYSSDHFLTDLALKVTFIFSWTITVLMPLEYISS